MERLAGNKGAWAAAPLSERIAVLKEIRARLLDELVPWARAAASIRCATSESAVAQDCLVTALTGTSQIDAYLASLEHLQRYGCLPKPPTSTAASGQTVVDVFPTNWRERRLNVQGAGGVTARLYLQAGKPETQGHFYREPHSGKLAVVLGAGNQHFLALSDVLHLAFVEGCVCMLKYHPLMAPVAPYIDRVLEPLARRGFYASATSPELAVAQQLLYSPLTDSVHITGGAATHDAIVWGSDPAEQARRRAANDPLLKVPISSELGCVTPWLVVPGQWSSEEITHHARMLTEAIANNCSCNCLAPKVVMLADGWEQADEFVAAVKSELALRNLPAPYYPGLRQRYEAFKQAYPQAEAISAQPADRGAACGEPLPYLVNELPTWPAEPSNEYAFRVEPFAPVVTFAKVPADAAARGSLAERFLAAAVPAANNDLWGSLSCTVLVHPATEAAHPAAVQRALDDLQFGSVVVNSWSVTGFIMPQGHWGGYQDGTQTIADVGSGIGAVHNSYMYDYTQKAVVRTPFVSSLHTQPERYAPLTLGPAKFLAGLIHGGPLGALRMALSRS
jgi:acyl-CoA reductase-like NAD-dependent aldehyde dehydrogenase